MVKTVWAGAPRAIIPLGIERVRYTLSDLLIKGSRVYMAARLPKRGANGMATSIPNLYTLEC